MSLVRAEPARVRLYHDRVELQLPGVPARQVDCGPGERGAVLPAALGRLLDEAGLRRGRLALTLGCDLVRLELLPWREEIERCEEFAAYARCVFEDIYGAPARGWQVLAARGGRGEARLAVAVERELIEGLRVLAGARGLHLCSLRPSLAALFEARRRSLPESYLLLLAEAGRACLALVRDGRWQSLRVAPGGDSDEALSHALERECHLLELAPAQMPPLFVCAPRREPPRLAAVNGVLPLALAGA